MTIRNNPISLDEAIPLIEAKRWLAPKGKESAREFAEREAYNAGIDEALAALSCCKRLKITRRAPRKLKLP